MLHTFHMLTGRSRIFSCDGAAQPSSLSVWFSSKLILIFLGPWHFHMNMRIGLSILPARCCADADGGTRQQPIPALEPRAYSSFFSEGWVAESLWLYDFLHCGTCISYGPSRGSSGQASRAPRPARDNLDPPRAAPKLRASHLK